MLLRSVNVGQGRPVPRVGKPGNTGIYKLPVSEKTVRITSLGLEGDEIHDTENHRAEDTVSYGSFQGDTVSATGMFRYFIDPDASKQGIRRYLDAPIAIRDRVAKEERLRELHPRKVEVGHG